nr:MAG TPA: hypothetical protein [Caudoviricetes sp.]
MPRCGRGSRPARSSRRSRRLPARPSVSRGWMRTPPPFPLRTAPVTR